LRLIADLEEAEAAFSNAKPKAPAVDVPALWRPLHHPCPSGFFARYPEIQLHIGEGIASLIWFVTE